VSSAFHHRHAASQNGQRYRVERVREARKLPVAHRVFCAQQQREHGGSGMLRAGHEAAQAFGYRQAQCVRILHVLRVEPAHLFGDALRIGRHARSRHCAGGLRGHGIHVQQRSEIRRFLDSGGAARERPGIETGIQGSDALG
jgi:hypothetical protein